jgi:hypothetical protein
MRAAFITTPLENGSQLADVQRAADHRDPSTPKLYDRRGYNPEKAASFFARRTEKLTSSNQRRFRTPSNLEVAMTSRAGVGYSENPISREAGAEVARAALADGGLSNCDLVLVYSTEKHDPAQLRDGIRSVLGPEPRLIGGYSMGIITNDRLGYAGYQVGLIAVASDTMRIDMFIEPDLVDREY